jgi:hypothetical protein
VNHHELLHRSCAGKASFSLSRGPRELEQHLKHRAGRTNDRLVGLHPAPNPGQPRAFFSALIVSLNTKAIAPVHKVFVTTTCACNAFFQHCSRKYPLCIVRKMHDDELGRSLLSAQWMWSDHLPRIVHAGAVKRPFECSYVELSNMVIQRNTLPSLETRPLLPHGSTGGLRRTIWPIS